MGGSRPLGDADSIFCQSRSLLPVLSPCGNVADANDTLYVVTRMPCVTERAVAEAGDRDYRSATALAVMRAVCQRCIVEIITQGG
jgi:hypothetical protein